MKAAKTTAQILNLLLLLVAPLCAAEFSIDCHTVTGGGGTSSGGDYEVSGTIGQADANPTMSGEDYAVEGGFWTLIASVQAPCTPSLTISVTTTNTVIVSWPSASTRFVLQETPDANTANWSDSKLTPSFNGATSSVIVPVGVENRFFRLQYRKQFICFRNNRSKCSWSCKALG